MRQKTRSEHVVGSNNLAGGEQLEALQWLRAQYTFHTYSYRDPRSVFAAAVGSPVVSPTTVILGIASSLFRVGKAEEAQAILQNAHLLKVCVDAPAGMIFFRAFHQIRRYDVEYIGKDRRKGVNPRFGLTNISQATREHALVEGAMTLYVAAPESFERSIRCGLENLTHLGTHDSLCSLCGAVEEYSPACHLQHSEVIYLPSGEVPPEQMEQWLQQGKQLMIVTLSRIKPNNKQQAWKTAFPHWWLCGDKKTEIVAYLIAGRLEGTSRGKIYKKHS